MRRLYGTLNEEGSDRPLAGLLVRAYDEDLFTPHHLGDAVTGATGAFEIQYAFGFYKEVDLYLLVYDVYDNLLHTTEVRQNALDVERFEIRIRIPSAKLK